jgi:hypothetical protein
MSRIPSHRVLLLKILSRGSFHLHLDDLVAWLAGFIGQKHLKLEDLGRYHLCKTVMAKIHFSIIYLLT